MEFMFKITKGYKFQISENSGVSTFGNSRVSNPRKGLIIVILGVN